MQTDRCRGGLHEPQLLESHTAVYVPENNEFSTNACHRTSQNKQFLYVHVAPIQGGVPSLIVCRLLEEVPIRIVPHWGGVRCSPGCRYCGVLLRVDCCR